MCLKQLFYAGEKSTQSVQSEKSIEFQVRLRNFYCYHPECKILSFTGFILVVGPNYPQTNYCPSNKSLKHVKKHKTVPQ